MRSIRRRLVSSLVMLLFLLVALFGAVLYLHARQALLGQFDADLLAKARAFGATSELDRESGVEFDFAEVSLPEFQPSPQAEYYQVWNSRGEVLIRSPSLGENHLPHPVTEAKTPLFVDVNLIDGRSGRAVAMLFTPRVDREEIGEIGDGGTGEFLTLVMARSREELDRALGMLLLGVVLAGLVLPACAGFLVHRIVRRGLRPLDRVAQQASSMNARRLDVRFPTEGMPEELLPICRRLNQLFERLEEAFRRERRFTADAAHELRTPIAELRSLAEVALQEAGDGEVREAFEDALDIAVRMGNLTEALLELARCESGQQRLDRQEVDVSALILNVWRKFEGESKRKEITADIRPSSRLTVMTDPALLGAILTNVLSNTVAHTPRGGTIDLEASDGGGPVRIIVSNTSDKLTPDDLGHLFEPFWRKDPARSDARHAGLGLAVVEAYCRLLNAELGVDLPSKDRFRLVLKFSGRNPTVTEESGR